MARKVGLTLEEVVDAAAEIADAAGLDAVTLAAVSARLRVRSPSLYSHVEGLPGLRRVLSLRAAGAMEAHLSRAALDHRGVQALLRLSRAYRRFASRHPGLYAAVQRAPTADEDPELYRALAAVVAPVLGALAEVGIPAAERVHLARSLRAGLHGFVSLEQGGGFGMPDSVEQSFECLVELLLSGVRQAAARDAVARPG